MEQDSPLSVVQHALHVYTDRRPATTEAVADMAADALATMGSAGVALAERVACGLDTESTVRFGLEGAGELQRLAEAALGHATPNAVRWGSVAFLGALSLAYDTDPAAVGSGSGEAIAATAKELLWNVHQTTGNEAVRDFTGVMLRAPTKPRDDIAIELLDLPYRVDGRLEGRTVTAGTEDDSTAEGEHAHDSRTMGNPVMMHVDDLKINPAILEKMDWLVLDGVTEYTVTPVLSREEIVAYAVDLIPFNTKVAKTAAEFSRQKDALAGTFNRLGATIAQYAQGNQVDSVRSITALPLLYAKNIASNARISRTYFTPLGNYHADGQPMVGVIGMALGKEAQSIVLKTITGQRRNFRTANL